MASKITNYFLSLFFMLNLVFFTYVSACGYCGSGPSSGGTAPGSSGYSGSPGGTAPGTGGSSGSSGSPGGTAPGTGGSSNSSSPSGGTQTGGSSNSSSSGSSGGSTPGTGGSSGSSSTGGTCPINALKLGVCANVLNGLLNITIGTPSTTTCCPLLEGLVDAEVAACLCTAIRANILGINLNIPLSLSLLVNYCGTQIPTGFQCS